MNEQIMWLHDRLNRIDKALSAIAAGTSHLLEQSTMSEHEMERRERCVDLAAKYAAYRDGADLTDIASAIYDFITGADRAALADEAKAVVDKLAK